MTIFRPMMFLYDSVVRSKIRDFLQHAINNNNNKTRRVCDICIFVFVVLVCDVQNYGIKLKSNSSDLSQDSGSNGKPPKSNIHNIDLHLMLFLFTYFRSQLILFIICASAPRTSVSIKCQGKKKTLLAQYVYYYI